MAELWSVLSLLKEEKKVVRFSPTRTFLSKLESASTFWSGIISWTRSASIFMNQGANGYRWCGKIMTYPQPKKWKAVKSMVTAIVFMGVKEGRPCMIVFRTEESR